MPSIKTFSVFGDRVDIFVDSATSHGLSSTLVQHVNPGGGPPPHSHINEDETFVALDSGFELLVNGTWAPLVVGEAAFAPRGSIHTFRNAGKTTARLLVVVTPGGFENYLQEIGPLSPAMDLGKIIEISKRYGVTFHL
ncbi:MAG TPA: cupin domain-containing protein [Edaphobacter sp.]|nr:cupin domain-containing protein [Edaphobacter sp.]